MPNNPILPSDEISGQTALPLSRIKKIVRLDEEISQCPNNTTFLIAVATEMFIRHLTEQGYNVVKSERKPRKNLQYRDLAAAVSRIENLEFLSDVIPKTTTYKQFKEKKSKEAATESGTSKGQRLLNGRGMLKNGGDHAGTESAADGRDESSQSALAGIPMVIHSSHARSLMTEGVIETTRQDDDDEDEDEDEDVDMLDS